MTDDELDVLIRATTPFTDARVAALDLGASQSDLMQAIISTPVTEQQDYENYVGPHGKGRRRRRGPALVGLAAAVAVLIALAAVFLPRRGDSSAYAAEIVAVAKANERLLIGVPGWSVTRADEFTITRGEMTFTDGTHQVDLNWYPAADYPGFSDDRAADGNTQTPINVLGRSAIMYNYRATTDFSTLVAPSGDTFLEIRGDVGSEAAYRSVLDSLEPVSVDAWLAALPASVVKPTDRTRVIEEMLVGVPLPDGFDVGALNGSVTVSDRYQLATQVTGAVLCVWFDKYFTAIEHGDRTAAQTASDALITSHNWPILHETAGGGGWSDVVWQYADATNGGGIMTGAGPQPITREAVRSTLGC